MRLALLVPFVASAALYGFGAVYFWEQERLAQSLVEARETPLEALHHPEATLALVRESFDANDYSPNVQLLIERSVRQLPAFYQSPLHIAVYHANRFEEPGRTLRAFEAAVRRYPSNGRLRLDHARWLLMAPSLLPPIEDTNPQGRARDLSREGEMELGLALWLEPELTRAGLETLRRRKVPAERWLQIVPDTVEARRQLVAALAESGERNGALALLRELVPRYVDARHFRQAAAWALSWGDPELALEAVERWQKLGPAARAFGIEPHEAGLLAARAYLATGDAEAGYETFRATLELVEPSSRWGLKLLCAMGEEYLRRQQVVLAESIFSEAATYAPAFPDAVLGLARTYDRTGRIDEAVERYDELLRIDPDHAVGWRELGSLLRRRAARGRP